MRNCKNFLLTIVMPRTTSEGLGFLVQDRHLPHDTYTRFGEVVKRLVRYDIQVGHAMNTNVKPKKNARKN